MEQKNYCYASQGLCSMRHKSVLLKELIDNLNLKPGMTVVDGTLGAGGHSLAVLEKILPGGKLISIDWDRRAVKNFQKKITDGIYISGHGRIAGGPAPVASNANGEDISPSAFVPLFSGDKIVGYWRGANDNYSSLDKILGKSGIKKIDAVFADLGFSSDQIEDAKRGFSFLKDGPLDMRYSPETQPLTAADVVNKYPEEKLVEIFWKYGEEKFARRIAREIRNRREKRKIREIRELVEIISKAIPEKQKHGRIHFATRIFQALRIEVNQELKNLKVFLEKAVDSLALQGKSAIISFHSLEDRIVKQFFQKESQGCLCPPKFPKCACDHKARLKIITKKPIVSSLGEIKTNPRARSAKLRVAEKI